MNVCVAFFQRNVRCSKLLMRAATVVGVDPVRAGALAFCISPLADNLTTSLLMGAVVTAMGKESEQFVVLGCINIVVAANAGGAFSPFGVRPATPFPGETARALEEQACCDTASEGWLCICMGARDSGFRRLKLGQAFGASERTPLDDVPMPLRHILFAGASCSSCVTHAQTHEHTGRRRRR
jgi:Citrate transporter